MPMNIKKVHIDEIRPYWRNPRKNDKAVEAVKHSINKFGYNQPIVVDKNMVIIAGHTRYKAIRELGIEEVEVLIKYISEEMAKEYRIADNKAAEKSKWDHDLLLFELRELDDLEDMEIFFDNGELDDLIEISKMDFEEEEEDAFSASPKAAASFSVTSPERTQEQRDTLEQENKKIHQLEEDRMVKFSQDSEEKGDDYIEVQCPHCEEKYVLSKSELLRASKVRRAL
jgi:hypothetical protein